MKSLKLLTMAIVAATAAIAQDVLVNETNFPDPNFRNFLSTGSYGGADILGSIGGQDGIFTQEELKATKILYIDGKNISSIKGIEFFTYLEKLYCYDNQLTSIDISKNTMLEELRCNNNQLTTLDVSKNPDLEILYCSDNQLTTLDVSMNTKLEMLGFGNNNLTSIDVSMNTKLETLNFGNNNITSIDVSKNTALESLMFADNQITTIDISKNTNLGRLTCNNNQLTSIDVSNNKNMLMLECANNKLSELDISNNPEIMSVVCDGNNLYGIDLSMLKEFPGGFNELFFPFKGENQTVPLTLEDMGGYYGVEIVLNNPTNLATGLRYENGILISESNTISSSPFTVETKNEKHRLSGTFIFNYTEGECPSIQINETTFPDENFRNWISTRGYGLDGIITCEEIEEIDSIEAGNEDISNMKGIEYFYNLEYLDCSKNELTNLDVSENKKLAELKCYENHLYEIDLSMLPYFDALMGRDQTVPLTLTEIGGSYGIEISLNNPTNLAGGGKYENGILSIEDNTISSSPFTVETGKDGSELSGTFIFDYHIHDWTDWSEWNTVKEPSCSEDGIKTRTRYCISGKYYETQTEIIPKLSDCDENTSGYLVFVDNVVSDKAEIGVVVSGSEEFKEVKIKIFDALGNMLFEKSSTLCSPDNPIVWNLKNDNGRNVSSGTYFVVAEVKTTDKADNEENFYRYTGKFGVKR